MDKDLQNKKIAEMSRDEIFELFNWYDFKEENGHPLTSCEPFQELVEILTQRTKPMCDEKCDSQADKAAVTPLIIIGLLCCALPAAWALGYCIGWMIERMWDRRQTLKTNRFPLRVR